MVDEHEEAKGAVIPAVRARRRYPRFSKDCEIRYKILEIEEMPHEAETVNISGGGACFKSDSEVPNGSVIAVEITLPKARAPVLAMGKVVWSKQNEDGTYENGVEFWWLGYRGEEEMTATPLGAAGG